MAKNYSCHIRSHATVTQSDCWEWELQRLPSGYGRMSYRNRPTLVHRAIWEETYGPIPSGLCVCHRCDNPPCCNPAHLFLGTHKQNTADSSTKGRNKAKLIDTRKQRVRKLTHEQVDEILSSPEPSSVLAARLGCTYTNVYMIRRGLRKKAPRK